MATRIRVATAGDAAAICDVLECCGEDHHNNPALIAAWTANKTVAGAQAWLTRPDAWPVAERHGAIAGFALLQAGEIVLCYLVAQARFQGVGKSLLSALEIHAEQAGLSSLHLNSTRTAISFHRRNGSRWQVRPPWHSAWSPSP